MVPRDEMPRRTIKSFFRSFIKEVEKAKEFFDSTWRESMGLFGG